MLVSQEAIMSPRFSCSILRLPAVLLLLALLLPILASCGAAPNAAQEPVLTGPPSVVPAHDSLGVAPSAAPAALPTMSAPASGGLAAPSPERLEIAPALKDDGSGAGAPMPYQSESGADVAVPLPQPSPISPPEQISNTSQQGVPLKAGDVDDNADFAAYQEYLRSYGGPPAHAADVSERYILTVVNNEQRPVLDARVRLFDDQRLVFEGRTYAGGKTIFLPRVLGGVENVQSLRVVVEKGNSTVEGTLQLGQDSTQTFVLRDAVPLPQTPRLDVLFLLDATGSMGDEIAQIQSTIVSIAERVDRIEPRPALRFGLVAYRDRGDEYVTRSYDFTSDVASFRQQLLGVRADGGGDGPESVNEALHVAIQQAKWADDAVRLTFLVADAPPHLDYPQDFDYIREASAAVAKGVKIYTIAASNTDD